MTASFAVAQAQAALVDAESTERKQRRTALINRLEQTRAELRAKRKELELLTQTVRQGQVDSDNVRRAIVTTEEQLGASAAARPVLMDFLPHDEDCVRWRSKYAELEARLEQLSSQRQALPNLHALRFSGAQLIDSVRALEFAESDILRQLQNIAGGKWPEGDVSGVL